MAELQANFSGKIALRWMQMDLTDDKSTLVQVMAWCHQAPSHYLSQCWPYDVTRLQWVKGMILQWFATSMPVILCWVNSMIHGKISAICKIKTNALFHFKNKIPHIFIENWFGCANQSGTKPNLVAKIWPPNLVTICTWLPKFVDNLSSKIHHLDNTGLAVGSFARWLPLMVAHTCKLDTIWVVYISPIWNGSIRLWLPLNTLCPVEFYIQWCVALHQTHWGWYFKKLICPCIES